MTEYRTERVSPEHESGLISILNTFGWELVSSQEIYNESTEVVGADIKIYGDDFFGGFMQGATGSDGRVDIRRKKTVTNYVVLKFERDTLIPEYDKLKSLNEEFEQLAFYEEPKKPNKRTIITGIGIFLIIVSVIYAIINWQPVAIWEILVCVAFTAVTVPITVLGWRKYKRLCVAYREVQERLDEIYEEAVALKE